MIELGVSNLKKQFGDTTIFENITFELSSTERLGLIGANGVGKTTLMKILMGMEKANEGDVFKRKGASFGYLNQIPDYGENILAIEVVEKAFEDLNLIDRELKDLERDMSLGGDKLDKLIKRHGNLSIEYERLGGYMKDTNLKKVMIGLSISEEMQVRPFHLLSGGEQTRIVLAKILLEKPDVLLLDEPSNHLDMASIEWLEEYLKEYEGAVLIISHDRYFLDRVVGKIVELTYDEALIYHGNYTYYTIEKERRFLIAMKHYEQQQKKIKKMEEQIKRYRIWGEMRDSDKMYRRAKELEKRLVKMDKLQKPQYEKRKMALNMSVGHRSGKRVMELSELTKSFDDKVLFKEANLTLWYKDFLCVLGSNGTGKTTLLKILTGELKADHGQIKIGSRIHMGYLPQVVEFDDENVTIMEYFQSIYPVTNGEARKQLAKALFVKDDVFKKLKVLSGGEKSRLKLNVLMYGDVNLMLLDEPTNHLDIDSREVLEENLLQYDGSLLFISHDRYFVDKMASRIAEIEDSSLHIYEGDYQYYKEEKARRFTLINGEVESRRKNDDKYNNKYLEEKEIKSSHSKDINNKKGFESSGCKEEKVLSKNAKKRLEEIEIIIEAKDEELDELNEYLVKIGDQVDLVNDTMLRIQEKQKELELLYEEWEQITI